MSIMNGAWCDGCGVLTESMTLRVLPNRVPSRLDGLDDRLLLCPSCWPDPDLSVEARMAAREQALTPAEDAMTRVIAGGCLLGPAELRGEAGDQLPFWVPSFEVTDTDPAAIKPGDLVAIPSTVAVHPAFQGLSLRVVGRSWMMVSKEGGLIWDLTLLCCDADPDETVTRYQASALRTFWPSHRSSTEVDYAEAP